VVRYVHPADEDLIGRSVRADEISRRVRSRAIDIIERGALGEPVANPLHELIEPTLPAQ